ncbi:short-chain collagen C4-like [Mercenaria mercenaria]|uniref:short-chain collagen C4-like n=1 Tax=Mercenaria mercenaria TaxID=6596 RepID=UPI001E1D33CF|nr:short-chain collagen C4-like [Mercenaria mercenaria]
MEVAVIDMNATYCRSQEHGSLNSATYIRWGRTSCPSGASVVYDGYVGGSYYSHSGAAVNALCLTKEPRWGRYTSKVESTAYIYGAEYETSYYSTWAYLHDHDTPCVVCNVPRNDVLMVPGSNICPNGYKREYTGYLMTGRYSHLAASKYICMDGKPETKLGGQQNQNGYLFYFVQARCGSLNCPPYVNGRELTCVVCSR